MNTRELVKEGYLEDILKGNGISLDKAHIELLDIMYCGDKLELEEWKCKYKKDKLVPVLYSIISKMLFDIADNCPCVHLFKEQLASEETQKGELAFENVETDI